MMKINKCILTLSIFAALSLTAGLPLMGAEGTATDSKKKADESAADNSAKNERDRDGTTLTPGDQSNTEADRAITQKIRRSIVEEKALSTTAKNIKIITIDGSVTLRGPVNNETEKKEIGDIATKIAAPGNVDNQLEIKTRGVETK